MKTKSLIFAALVLAMLNILLLATFSGGNELARSAAEGSSYVKTRKYVLYVGLNDKDTGTQLVSTPEARERLNAVAIRHVDGFTVLDGHGYWRGENDNLDSEETLIYLFYGVTDDQMASVMDGMLAAMNQSSILVEKSDAFGMFFYGSK